MEDLAKHVNELAAAVVVLTTTLAGLGALVVKLIRDVRAAMRDAQEATAERDLAEEAVRHQRKQVEAVVEGADTALQLADPETRRLMREKLQAVQDKHGVQQDVAAVVRVVRTRNETPETGVKVDP